MKPLLSIIIPAFNEEEYISETITSINKAVEGIGKPAEIIVVDNNSTDNTAKISKELGAKVVFESENHISKARNAGGKAAETAYLVFVDADTLISTELLQKAYFNMNQGGCCGGGSIVTFDRKIPFFAKVFTVTWNWLSVKRGVAAGSFVYSLKEAFDDVGGFAEEVYASEEIWFSRAVRHWGKKRGKTFIVIPDWPVVTSGRKFNWYSTMNIFLNLVFLMTFPIALRSKRLCKIWYQRPYGK